MRVHGKASVFERLLGIAKRMEGFEDFAFQTLHVFERDIEEVARAARRIEDARGTELAVKGTRGFNSCLRVAGIDLLDDYRLTASPVFAKRFHKSGNDKPLNVGTRSVVSAERMTLIGVECTFKQRAEYCWFNVSPARVSSFNQQPELVTGKWKRFGRFKKPAIELQNVRAQNRRKTALVHRLPESFRHGRKVADIIAKTFKQIEPTALRKQFHILSKRCEDAAGEEFRNLLRRMMKFEVASEDGQFAGDLARHFGSFARRVQRERIEPDGAKSLLDLCLLQLFMENAEGAGI